VEEKFIDGYDIPPLQVVGWEGAWGLSITSAVLLLMYYVPTAGTPMCSPNTGPNPAPASGGCPAPSLVFSDDACRHVEDAWDAAQQMASNPKILLFTVLNLCSIAFFNFFGVSVTKYVNSATRMVLDSLRTMVIWGFSMAVGWETFCYVQIIGFVVLLTGTFIFNGIIQVPGFDYTTAPAAPSEEAEAALLQQEGADYSELDASSLNPPEGVYSVKKFRR
jgi:hypothetical protein